MKSLELNRLLLAARTSNPFKTDDGDFEVVDATVVLNKNLAPVSDRVFVIDPFAQGEAMKQRAFQDLSWGGSSNMETFVDGTVGEKSKRFGFAFAMDQNMKTHTTGAIGVFETPTAGVAKALLKCLQTVAGVGS